MWILVGLGCSGNGLDNGTPVDTAVETVELVDVGMACLFGDGAPDEIDVQIDTTFGSGTVEARVVLDDCASGCSRDVVAGCAVRIVQTEVVVDATATYTHPVSTTVGCPAVCVEVAATCEADALAAGTWTLDYGGGHSDAFAAPATVPAPCATSLRGR